MPGGDSAVVADMAASIAKLTATEIAGLPALHVTQLETTDTGVTLDLAQALSLEPPGSRSPCRAATAPPFSTRLRTSVH